MKDELLTSEIRKKLRRGSSKTTIYQEYREKFDDTLLRRTLASRPSRPMPTQFRMLHQFVLWVWVVFVAFELISLLDLFSEFNLKSSVSFAISVYLAVQLWKFNGDAFLPAAVWLSLAVIGNIAELAKLPVSEPDYDFITSFTWSFVLLLSLTICLMYVIRKKVFGYYKWFRPKVDGNNEIIFQ